MLVVAGAATCVAASGLQAQTLAKAQQYLEASERELAARQVPPNRASWVAATFITDDTEELSAYFGTDYYPCSFMRSHLPGLSGLIAASNPRLDPLGEKGPTRVC